MLMTLFSSRGTGDRWQEAGSLVIAAGCEHHLGQRDVGDRHLRQALARLDDFTHDPAVALRAEIHAMPASGRP